MTGSSIVAQRERPSASSARASRAPSGVTAVVCTHRGEAFLAQQLASILRQSVPVDEVIVSDDASPDGTVALSVRTLEASDAPYRVFTRDVPLRVAANFAFGIERARTPLVALADQDDLWHVDKVARLAPLLADDDGAQLAHSDARLVDATGNELEASLLASLEISDAEWAAYVGGSRGATAGSPSRADDGSAGRANASRPGRANASRPGRAVTSGPGGATAGGPGRATAGGNVGPGPDQFGVLLRRNLVTGATAIVRRDFAIATGAAPSPWIHDEWLAIAAALRSGIRVLAEPLIDYRQHGSNQIGQVTPTLRDKLDKVLGPGHAEQVRRVERAEALRQRLAALGATPEQRVEVDRKLSHERRRLDLPDARLARVPAVLRGWRRGDYARYSSRGTLDVVRDALHSRRDRAE